MQTTFDHEPIIVDATAITSIADFAKRRLVLADLRDRYKDLPLTPIDTPEGEELHKIARRELQKLRTGAGDIKKELKAEALAYNRRIDAEFNELVGEIAKIENPLVAIYDEHRKKAEREAMAKAVAAQKAAEEEQARVKAAEEARLKAIRDAEEARIAEERRKLEEERAKLDEERRAREHAFFEQQQRESAEHLRRDQERRKEMEAERAAFAERQKAAEETQRAEQAKLAEQRRQFEEAQEKLREEARKLQEARVAESMRIETARINAEAEKNRIEFERVTAERLAKEASDKAERDRVAAAKAEQDRIAAEKAEAVRQEALKPDKQRMKDFAAVIRSLIRPTVKDAEAEATVVAAVARIKEAADILESFVAVKKGRKN